jgi:hypothetical protein
LEATGSRAWSMTTSGSRPCPRPGR